jgi:hypothetical protein
VLLTAAAALPCLFYTSMGAAAAAAAEGPAAAALPAVPFTTSVCPMLALLLPVIDTIPAGLQSAGNNQAAIGTRCKVAAGQWPQQCRWGW